MECDVARSRTPIFLCQKSQREVSLAEARCLSPASYCKWRTACPIDFFRKEEARASKAG